MIENILYSPFKVAHHLDKIEKLKHGILSSLTCAQIDITNQCNHNCVYCILKVYKNFGLGTNFNKFDYIVMKDMIKILDGLKEVEVPAIEYTGGGEPQYHPNFSEILKETIDRKFEYSLVTNGATFSEKNIEYFKKASWVRISVDAACSKTHKKMHGASINDFDKIIFFIKTLIKECANTIVGVSFIISPINYKEIISAAELFKEIGCSNIRFSLVYTSKGIKLFKKYLKQIENSLKIVKKLETDKFKVFNLINFSANNMINHNRNYKFCGYQYFITSIGADQNVYPCCTLRYDNTTSLGNLKNEKFKDIWFGETHKKWLSSNYLEKKCNNHFCLMDKKNEFIEYLTMIDAPHINYI